jgi:hypothetical protein
MKSKEVEHSIGEWIATDGSDRTGEGGPHQSSVSPADPVEQTNTGEERPGVHSIEIVRETNSPRMAVRPWTHEADRTTCGRLDDCVSQLAGHPGDEELPFPPDTNQWILAGRDPSVFVSGRGDLF